MPLVTPPAIAPLPTPPSSSDPANFDTRADAFLGALPGLQSEANTLAQNVYGNAQEAQRLAQDAGSARQACEDAAARAAHHAAVAGAASNARSWSSGRGWSENDVVWGVDNPGVLFRCIAAHANGTRKPDEDSAHWASVGARLATDPLAGPSRVTFTRDVRGYITQITARIDGKDAICNFSRDAGKRFTGAVITYERMKQTITCQRNTAGRLESLTSEVTSV